MSGRFLWVGMGAVVLCACAHKPATQNGAPAPAAPPSEQAMTSAEVLAQTTVADWRPLDPENTLYVELPAGRVVIELAPTFAPNHVLNIKTLVRAHYFDGLPIVRVQDNYVVQWGDPEEDAEQRRPLGSAQESLGPEFTRPAAQLAFTPLPDGDVYAPEVGWAGGFPAARDPKSGKAWLTHCYGALGVGRGDDPGSGNGAELYVVIGHAPRHLDRNITLAGRVVKGMDLLSALPRGTAPLGFYEKRSQYVTIKSIRVAADVPLDQRTDLEMLRTDTPAWSEWVESRRNRRESWFVEPVGHVELCNVPLPVRARSQ